MKKKLLAILALLGSAVAAVTINSGWNMIGTNVTISDFSPFDNTNVAVVYKYDTANSAWKKYQTGTANEIGQLAANEGVWVYATASTALSLPVNASGANTLLVKSGWQIGATAFALLDMSQLNQPALLNSVWKYNGSSYTVYRPNGASTLSSLSANDGFWMYGVGSGQINLQSSTGSQTSSSGYTLLAWNDLGMHCIDGTDYSVFSILPPYNNLRAQLVDKSGKLVSNATLTYEATTDTNGSINTSSKSKTNFWTYIASLFGVSKAEDVGLADNPTPSLTPAKMSANGTLFSSDGIPITPYDDAGAKNSYPMVKVVARDASGNLLASTKAVLPVSDEMNCKACHASNSGDAAKPSAGWVNNSDGNKDWKLNILRLHDEFEAATPTFKAALTKMGAASLSASVAAGKPILCASCHTSNALGVGTAGISALTAAIHSRHSMVKDPASGVRLDSINNRTSCYLCHPGATTQCLRGAMGTAKDANGALSIDCQSCHGNMKAVGSASRKGWMDEPNCQACHHDGVRETTAVDASGNLRTWLDSRFATNPNTLYKLSSGHGNLNCEACHGSTHAEYPSADANDNVQSIALQSYAGTVTECSVCHKTVPTTANAGPHGMHTIGDSWVSSHRSYAKGSGKASCTTCHGSDYRGTPLSKIKIAKSFNVDGRQKSFAAGHQMNCYDCHNGPSGD